MNKQEMNELIAEKIMGYVRKTYKGLDGWGNTNDTWFSSGFNPTNDIKDAWSVAQKLYITVSPQCGAPKELSVHAEINNQPIGNYYEAFGETASMAISKVALKSYGLYKGDE